MTSTEVPTNSFGTEIERIKSSIGTDTKQLPNQSIYIIQFIEQELEYTKYFSNRKEYKKAFLRLKSIEELIYIVVRA